MGSSFFHADNETVQHAPMRDHGGGRCGVPFCFRFWCSCHLPHDFFNMFPKFPMCSHIFPPLLPPKLINRSNTMGTHNRRNIYMMFLPPETNPWPRYRKGSPGSPTSRKICYCIGNGNGNIGEIKAESGWWYCRYGNQSTPKHFQSPSWYCLMCRY